MRFFRKLWNRIRHEFMMKWRGWDYTEKPMLGKKLWVAETKYFHFPPDFEKPKYILFVREKE